MSAETTAKALLYIKSHNVMTLATNGVDGIWAAAVFYVSDGFDFYFLSAGHTRHAQNFKTTPKIAATIQEEYSDWTQIKGVQLEGNVSLLEGVSRETIIEKYLDKHPYVATTAPLNVAIKKVNWYLLTPEKLYFIDNSKGLGHRDLILGPNMNVVDNKL